MEDMGLKICPRCGEVISYSHYFKTYYCYKCGYFEEDKIKEIIEFPRYYINDTEIENIFETVLGDY